MARDRQTNVTCQKRDLRTRIARSRRRVDRRLAGLSHQRQRLTSWQTYVARFPLQAMGLAFGAGLVLSGGWSARGWSRWLGRRVFESSGSALQGLLWGEVLRWWRELSLDHTGASTGASELAGGERP